MIVACPNCTTKYNLPDDKVPADGVKVKCSKCSHLFKVAPPPATPEEEVEVLLDDAGSQEPDKDQSSDFDAAFEEAVSGGEGEEDGATAAGDAAEDDSLADMDFGGDDTDEADEDFDADIEEEGDEDLEEDLDEDMEDAAEEDDDFDADFGEDNEDEGYEPDPGLFASLDEGMDQDKRGKRGGFGRLLMTLLLLLLLLVVTALVTYNLRLWSVPESMQDMSIELPFELPIAVPFVKGGEPTGDAVMDEPDEASMGDPLDRIRQIQPVDFRQYVINNEVEGRIFVVEGQALNNSETPKEQIKVEVALFNAQGVEIIKQERLAGNTLSLFQLQVDSRDTINENLDSSRGTNLNNSYIKPGETTPFMFVFFDLSQKVEEYRISITDARDPQR